MLSGRLLRVTVVTLLAITLLGFSTAAAQEKRSYADFPISRINMAGSTNCPYLLSWQVTKKKSGVIFGIDEVEDEQLLFKYILSHKGKISGFSILGTFMEGEIWDARALWLGGDGGSMGPAANNMWGLLFTLRASSYPAEEMILSVARFNNKGNLLGNFTELGRFDVPANSSVNRAYLEASQGPDSICVAISLLLLRSEGSSQRLSSRAFIGELDFQGQLLGDMPEVAIPGGGQDQWFILMSPCCIGRYWLTPAVNARFVTTATGTNAVGNDLYVLRTTAGKATTKLRLRRLSRDNQNNYWSYRSAMFIPSSSSASSTPGMRRARAKKTTTLFFGHRNYIPEAQQTLDLYTTEYYLVQVSQKGKMVGDAAVASPTITVQIPGWSHTIQYDPNKETRRHEEMVSNIITSGDGSYYLAQLRSLWLGGEVFAPPILYDHDFEHEFSIYSLNLQSGEVDTVARGTASDELEAYSLHTWVRWLNGKVAVLNHLYDCIYPFGHVYYFSRIRP